jgi:hypothetical protein
VRIPGLVPSDIAAALGVIVDLTLFEESDVDGSAYVDGSATERATAIGARAVHFVDPSGPTPSYSVSSQSSSIDSCVVRVCSCGHRCSGSYTPRVTTCSIESVPNNESAGQMSSGDDGGT